MKKYRTNVLIKTGFLYGAFAAVLLGASAVHAGDAVELDVSILEVPELILPDCPIPTIAQSVSFDWEVVQDTPNLCEVRSDSLDAWFGGRHRPPEVNYWTDTPFFAENRFPLSNAEARSCALAVNCSAYLTSSGGSGAPGLVGPSLGIATGSPEYQWTGTFGDAFFYLNVWDDFAQVYSGWVSAEDAGCANGGDCSFTPQSYLSGDAALPYGRYRFYALTYNGTLPLSPYSDPLEFHVGAVTLISPFLFTRTFNPIYRWDDNESALAYLLYIADENGVLHSQWYSRETAGCGSGSGICAAVPSVTVGGGPTTWYIKTYYATGMGAWSVGNTFTSSPHF